MTFQQWLLILASLIGGGAMGAILTALITNYRNRVQSIYCTKQHIPVLHQSIVGVAKSNSKLNLKAELVISDGNTDYSYENLSIVKIEIENTSNKDMPDFTFGATLREGDKILHIEPVSDDRHHIIEMSNSVSLLTPLSEVDFTLRPFNRKDVYQLSLFVTTMNSELTASAIQLSSRSPVKLVDKIASAKTHFIKGGIALAGAFGVLGIIIISDASVGSNKYFVSFSLTMFFIVALSFFVTLLFFPKAKES